jgi:hypothetical protein
MLGRATCAGVISLFVAHPVVAAPMSLTSGYSPYEIQAIHDAEQRFGAHVDPSPEGKTIERVDFVRLDPIDPHDPAPPVLDIVHTTTRAFVLRRELLVADGELWRQVLVDESARNLRALPQLSLVLCVPMQGSLPGRVRLVVITKDVWSLYVDFDLAGAVGASSAITLQPKESNLAGLHHALTGQLVVLPLSYSAGARYEIPRLDGRFLSLAVEGNVVVNRESGQTEGTYGTASVERPLFSSLTQWAGSAAFSWNDTINRTYAEDCSKYHCVLPYVGSDEKEIPWVYHQHNVSELLRVTRSLGWEYKNDFSTGFSLAQSRYTVPDAPTDDPATLKEFLEKEVPVGEDRVGPFVQWHSYTTSFSRILDVDTLGLQEDQRLGHEVWLRLYPVLRSLGSTRSLLGTYAAAAYTAPLGDGFARAAFETTVEAEADRISDASVTGAFAVVTPRTVVGRLVFSVSALNRWRNYLHGISFLGGDGRLRGYPTNAIHGKDLFTGNLEYRSRPIGVASIQLGGVAFYDSGDAFDGYDRLLLRQSLGFGLRAVLPQIERAAFRVDVGFPVGPNPPPGTHPVEVYFAFHQAVPIPAIGDGFGP